MNVIPIVFAFDHNLEFPACICISSLLMHAKPETFYDIYILYPESSVLDKNLFGKIKETYRRCNINFKTVSNVFEGAFEIRNITTPTYYRLLIPELIPEYDKVIYSDVDVIFRTDLSSVYGMEMGDSYVAGTYDIDMNIGKDGIKHIDETEGLVSGEYIQAGFIMLNAKKMREDTLQPKLLEFAKRQFKFQDQDILNIACAGNTKILPWHYNMTTYSFYYLENEYEKIKEKYANSDQQLARHQSNIHYNGQKPWKGACINFDIWWEYYRKSPFFDERYYYQFFENLLNEHDRLPLLKRIKILLRYFVYGRKK